MFDIHADYTQPWSMTPVDFAQSSLRHDLIQWHLLLVGVLKRLHGLVGKETANESH